MAMPASEPNPYRPNEENEALDMGFIYRKSAMNFAFAHYRVAQELHRRAQGREKFVTSASADTPLEEANAILLTRDGEQPYFEQQKEMIYIYFPVLEHDEDEETPFPMIWFEYFDEEGNISKYTVTDFRALPYDEDEPTEGELEESTTRSQQLSGLYKRIRRILGFPDQEQKGLEISPGQMRRYRDLIQNFKVTPQAVDPFERYPRST